MTALVDSDRVADWLRGRPAAVQLLKSLEPDGLAISLVTYGEVYEGIYYGRDPAGSERVFRQFLRAVDVLPLTRPIMRRFARLRGDLRRRGQLIGDPDLLIAATALHHDLTLVTGNRAHFQRIPDLRLHPPEHVAPVADGDGGRRVTEVPARSAAEQYAYLTTRGRRTGRAHRIEIWFVVHQGAVYFMAGGGDRADWVRNLHRDPAVRLRFGAPEAPEYPARARVVDGAAEGELDGAVRRTMAAKYQGWQAGQPLGEWARTALVVEARLDVGGAPDAGPAPPRE